MSQEDNAEKRIPIYYRIEDDRILVSEDKEEWTTVRMPNENTIRDLGNMPEILKRK